MPNISGWINLYKPLGVSSAAVLRPLKKSVQRGTKIGHAGTLDVAAEGVLPVAIGEATKLAQFLIDAKKEYQFTVQFGAITDSLDREGTITEQTTKQVSQDEPSAVVEQFIGQQQQMPPIYSALKVNGKRAYNLARSGEEVELKPRIIHIYELECLSFDNQKQQASYRVVCSKGTYIRSLARDIAKSLQNLGFVIELRRLKVGAFNIDASISTEDITAETLDSCLKVPEIVLDDIPGYEVSPSVAQKIKHGQVVQLEQAEGIIWLSCAAKLIAVGEIKEGLFYSKRVFNL